MKSPTYFKLVSSMLLIIGLNACSHIYETPFSEYFDIQFYDTNVSNTVRMKLEIDKNSHKVFAFGKNFNIYPASYIIDQNNSNYYSVMLMPTNSNKEIFYYLVNKDLLKSAPVLASLTKIDSRRGYINFFEYNWTNQEGKLIYKILIDNLKDGNERFKIILDYTNEEKSIKSFNALRENFDEISETKSANIFNENNQEFSEINEFKENLESTLSFFSDNEEYHTTAFLANEMSDWLGEQSDIVHYDKINDLSNSINFLWRESNTVYDISSANIDKMIKNGQASIPDNLIGKIVKSNENQNVINSLDKIEMLRKDGIQSILEKKIIKPDECNEMTQSGGYGVTVTKHFLGIDAGTVNINYEMYSIPDRMIVEYNGNEVAATPGNVSGKGTLSFYFDGNPPYDYTITMIGDDTGTAWVYVAGCPQ